MNRSAKLIFAVIFAAVPATVFAQPVIQARCTTDSLDPVQAEARLEWARKCGLTRNTSGPDSWFEDFAFFDQDFKPVKEYRELDEYKAFSGNSNNYAVNYQYANNLFPPAAKYDVLPEAAPSPTLMAPGSGKVDLKEPYRRLMQIDYFEAALAWRANPQREQVLQLTRDIIIKDNFSGDQDSARRQMLGGAKMELYRLLYEQDARRAEDIVAQAKGTRMESLITWMAEEELRRRTRETEIQKEVEALQEKAN